MVAAGDLSSGHTSSCGCLRHLMHSHNFEDLTGQTFGRLKVVKRVSEIGVGLIKWLCVCDCGEQTTVSAGDLKSGHTQSCGCFRRERSRQLSTIHGLSRSSEHRIWSGMIFRCENPNATRWDRYGGRGIKVCDRWRYGEDGLTGFECFLSDMGSRPSPQHSIDRYDHDGDYEPDNCRWATERQQQNNRSTNRRISYKGRTRTLSQWARAYEMNTSVLWRRLRKGWTIEAALNTPLTARKIVSSGKK